MKIAIIGGGFAGLSTASYLAKYGADVTIFEKNEQLGGRASVFKTDGFTFDMGPSWLWMPDVYERFFADFNRDFHQLIDIFELDPNFKIWLNDGTSTPITSNFQQLADFFESVEVGSSDALKRILVDARVKYEVSFDGLIDKPCLSFTEFIDWKVIKHTFKLDLLKSMQQYLKQHIKSPKLRQILEFPTLFLGGTAANTPALYNLINHSAFTQGTFYNKGGFSAIVQIFVNLVADLGIQVQLNEPVERFEWEGNQIKKVVTEQGEYTFDLVVAAADYRFVESQLIPKNLQSYSTRFWDRQVLAPTALLFYVGLDTKVEGLEHHNLFFDADFDAHASTIYDNPSMPKDPLFYVCCPSKTEDGLAPEGHENLFFLVPLGTDAVMTEADQDRMWKQMLERIKLRTGQDIEPNIVYKKAFAKKDFIDRYHAFKGNAYGLANTLMQTAFLKPKLKSKRVNNLYYSGQLTVPGPGVPPAIISGKIVADLIAKDYKL